MTASSTVQGARSFKAQAKRAEYIAWLGAVEAGQKGPECTSLPIRLRCILTLSGMKQNAWIRAANLVPLVVNHFLTGYRDLGDDEEAWQVALRLLKAAKVENTDLAWVMGWRPMEELGTLARRAERTVVVMLGSECSATRQAEYRNQYPALFASKTSDQKLIRQQVGALAKCAGGWASAEWLLKGVATPPAAIRKAATFLQDNVPKMIPKDIAAVLSRFRVKKRKRAVQPTPTGFVDLRLPHDHAIAVLCALAHPKDSSLAGYLDEVIPYFQYKLMLDGVEPSIISEVSSVRDDKQVREILMPRIPAGPPFIPEDKTDEWMRILGLPPLRVTIPPSRGKNNRKS